MNDDQEILTGLARVETKIEALTDRIDWLADSIQDHETRIRSLEDKHSLLIGKLTALMIITVTAVSLVSAWISTWH